MKIRKIQIQDFMGMRGKHEYDLTSPVTVLSAPNGSGKTTLISAIVYALTGIEPEGSLVTVGEKKAFVQITTDTGNRYMRSKPEKGAASYYMNGKRTTLGSMQDHLTKEMGDMPEWAAKLIVSSDLLQSISTQQFGELLLAYLPEQMTKETLLGRLTGLTQGQKKIVEGILPDGTFGTDALDAVEATLRDRRASIKKKRTELSAIIQEFDHTAMKPDIGETEDGLKAKLSALQKEQADAASYTAKKDAYDKAVRSKQEHDRMLADVNAQIAGIKDAVLHTDEEMKALETSMRTASEGMTAANAAAEGFIREAIDRESQLTRLDHIECPYLKGNTKGLKCETDMTPAMEDFKSAATRCRRLADEQQKKYAAFKKTAAAASDRLDKARRETDAAKKVAYLYRQKADLEKQTFEVPKEPKAGRDKALIDADILHVHTKLQYMKEAAKIDHYRTRVRNYTSMLADYEQLVAAFSPKGPVKETVTHSYLDTFSAPCNELADQLFPGMRVRFTGSQGVAVEADMRGSGQFVPFSSLSGGEKACVLFLLLDMLTGMSGFRMIVMDELSVLDADVFGRLIDIMLEHTDRFDQAVIACVSHTDTEKELQDRNIPVLKL